MRRGHGFLIVNPHSGENGVGELLETARTLGIECHVLRRDDDPAELARQADALVLGVAGGDGSLASVAAVAIERDLPFVCVPNGTRNHFARDVGLDRDDPFRALKAFTGSERRIDVGRANGRLFLNNLSLGLYAGLVVRREHHRRRGDALAGLRAVPRLVRERHRLRAKLDGETLRARILLVANNAYEVNLYTLGERASLDQGKLHLYAADGWLPIHWLEREGSRFRIEFDQPEVVAATDGEPLTLRPPLEVECVPKALRVLLPPPTADGS
jgi:diacylglycerol kinase family enzyme